MSEITIPMIFVGTFPNIPFLSGYIEIPGPQNSNNLTVNITMNQPPLSVVSFSPAFFQIRQGNYDGPDSGFLDQFAVQLIEFVAPTVDTASMRVRIRRLDQDSGWGQALRLDVLIRTDMGATQ